MTRRLIALVKYGYEEVEVDAGLATPEQIDASDAAEPCGFIRVNDRGDVVEPGSWDDQRPGVRTCYVEVES